MKMAFTSAGADHPVAPRPAVRAGIADCRAVLPRLALLCALLFVNDAVMRQAPAWWIAVPILLMLPLTPARFSAAEHPAIRLWQLIGAFSALYALARYPLMPVQHADPMSASLYGLLLLLWLASLACGIACFRIPALSLLPPAFLLWSNFAAGRITGIPIGTVLDVQPLAELACCIGFGLLINQAWLRLRPRAAAHNGAFAGLLPLLAIALHMANYFWSFYAKITLGGPPGAWVTQNNPAAIFLVALDDNHIIFSAFPGLVKFAYEAISQARLFANLWIIAIQFLAVAAFILPKRSFFVLLLLFDVMHLAIFLIAGANFWPWIILNLIITAVVAGPHYRPQPLALRLIATAFILASPNLAQIAKLGWYDSGANNKLFFEAQDSAGKIYDVPANFFTFYSYPIGHMDLGPIGPAFATGEPNGGVFGNQYRLFLAGRACNAAELIQPGAYPPFDAQRLTAFIRNYHALALGVQTRLGAFPYNVYPHHFYIPRAQSAAFDRLDKRRITAYIYRQQSVCVSFTAAGLQRKILSTAEYRIPIAN